MTSNRRELIKMLGLGSAASLLGTLSPTSPAHAAPAASSDRWSPAKASTGGLPPVTIRSVKAIGTGAAGRQFSPS